MNYQVDEVVVDYLPNVIELITNPTIQGAVAGEDGKLSVYVFSDPANADDYGGGGELVVFHSNWRGTIAIDGLVAVGDWDDQTSTLQIDANGGSCQIVGDQLLIETSALLV